jgi:uncharacterized protein DUF3298
VTTRAVVVTVTIEKELKANPAFPADVLAESKRFAAKARAEAGEEYKTNKDWFVDGGRRRRWTYERVYYFRSLVANRYVSIVRDDGTYTGGAHPNSFTNTILWDRDTRKRVNIRPFFRETADNGPTMQTLAQAARVAVAAEKLARDAINVDVPKEKLTPEELAKQDTFIANGIEPSLLKIGPISLAPSTEPDKSSGLTFHYSPYAVGAYAEGPYTVFVPWTVFQSHLSQPGAAIFGGKRPESDNIP